MKKNILGVGITDATSDEILKYIYESLEKKSDPYYIVTPNPEIIMRSRGDEAFRKILNNAGCSLCDGVGLYVAAKLLSKPLKMRITGVDMLEMLCKESVKKPVSIGFLGGQGSVAEDTAECLRKKYPGLKVSFALKELEITHKTNVDILFVAFGFPKQEIWMADNLQSGRYRVAIGVGGAFDYLSGSISRAPTFLRVIGLEWMYRLIRQPWRWRRQLSLFKFVLLVIQERVRK